VFVPALTEVLEVNWIILYFVYGQVFFLTGLIAVLQWRRGSHLELARPLPWLAAFGIAHGLNEWGYIFIPLQAIYLADPVVRIMVIAHLLLLAVSFFFLFQFGVELILPQLSGQRWLRVVPGTLLVLWGVAVFARGLVAQDSLNVLVTIADGWSRYFLSLPGSLLASAGLFYQAREMRAIELPRIAIYLTGAALAFAVYGLVGGLIVPEAPTFLAKSLNYAWLDRTIHVPAPVFRSICGLAMAVFVARSLEVFQVETDRRIEEMERAQIVAADRERIGRELHDGIIQNIYAAGLSLEDAHYKVSENPQMAQQRIQAVMADLNQAIQDIRRYIFDLRAAEQSRELEKILENLVRDLRLDTMLEVDLEVIGQRCCWLEPDRLAHITQIAREALSNVVQHADASHVAVSLNYQGSSTHLTVSDNGRGLSRGSMSEEGPIGQGIANMQARARMLGGELALQSSPEGGLQLDLVFPCTYSECTETDTEGQEHGVEDIAG
jgi:signal transduction histidine kinase